MVRVFSAISRFLLPSEPIGARDFLRSVREACRLRLGSQAFASGQPRIPPRSERQATVEDNLPVAEISKDSATFNNITPEHGRQVDVGRNCAVFYSALACVDFDARCCPSAASHAAFCSPHRLNTSPTGPAVCSRYGKHRRRTTAFGAIDVALVSMFPIL